MTTGTQSDIITRMSTQQNDHDPSMEYKTIAIVSLGLIGGSLALAFKRFGFAGKLIGVSRDATLEAAIEQKVIDEGHSYEDLCTVAANSDVVFLASPIHVVRKHLEALGSKPEDLRAGTIITDVGSTKKTILNDARQFLPDSVHFIGGHPMAGSEKRGLDAADPFLFQNAFYALTPAESVPSATVDSFGKFLSRTGARIVVLDAAVHDRTASAISHLPQLIAVALVNYLDELGDHRNLGVQLAAGGFRDMTRIASSSFDMWRDIYNTNATETRRTLAHFVDYLQRIGKSIGQDDLETLFDAAAATRAQIPSDSKGFLHPLREVLVVVEDKPGVIAEISTALAERDVNILDIEVLKVREGEGGTLRLAFSSLDKAGQAISLLEARGYTVRMRK